MNRPSLPALLRFAAALLFGLTAARFIHHYQIVEFPFAAAWAFAFAFFGYAFLSQKYAPGMNAAGFAVALALAFKAAALKPRPARDETGDAARNRLVVTAALVREHEIRTGAPPLSLDALPVRPGEIPGLTVELCPRDCPWPPPRDKNSSFALKLTDKNARDKSMTLWYVNGSFELYP